ncbi:MAG: hypothetical protein ACRC8S_13620 [Fimbriiglobus sp.]
MARKRKTATADTPALTSEATTAVETPAAIVAVPPATSEVVEPVAPAHRAELAPIDSNPKLEKPSSATNRPFWIQTVSLGNEKPSPKMRLGRSQQFQQMVIQFDEKPTDDTRLELGEAGWRWRANEGQWTKQLEFKSRATGQLEAEKLFDRIAQHERLERGLAAMSMSIPA